MLQADYLHNPFVTMDIPDLTFNATNSNASQETDQSYCLCGKPYNPGVFMIQCDSCKDWFHSGCINFREWKAVEIDRYHCPRCSPFVGPSISKTVHNSHRHDFWDSQAANKPVQTGTPTFINELCTRHFAEPDEMLLKLDGHELTTDYFGRNGFHTPILVDKSEGLGMTVPSDDFSYIDVMGMVGEDKEIDVIDVRRQANIRMNLGDFVQYVADEDRKRIFNVVSLEFSDTGMADLIEPPLIARKLDWANTIWPENCPGKPQVQKYCLMSVKDSYTDFHIDFGGTSVWYHVLRGEKVFLFIEPTAANLSLYSQWLTSSNQSETFFGDQVDQCFKCHVKQGETMLIPTGWIHAVYTPVDSLVFGGNFLHSHNIGMQLNCFEIEKKAKTGIKFMYPNFMMINYFAASKFLTDIIEINRNRDERAPPGLLEDLRALQQAMRHWNGEKEINQFLLNAVDREQLPFGLNFGRVIKDIGKEIRHAERIINHLHPPKPERESKRRRKRPVNKDFVDYSLSPKSFNFGFIPTKQPESTVTSSSSKPSTDTSANSSVSVPSKSSQEHHKRVRHKSSTKTGKRSCKKHCHKKKSRNISRRRSRQTVAEHKGGAVLKFRLGKDVARAQEANGESTIQPTSFASGSAHNEDVYDFHDESDKDSNEYTATMVEVPKKSMNNLKLRITANKTKSKGHTAHFSTNGHDESVLQALSAPSGSQVDNAIPSTSAGTSGTLATEENASGSKKRYRHNLEEPVNNVHQDEDYIYPSLDNSDDDEMHIFKPRGRTKVDEAWNPKARVGPLLPKMNRPAREGTKKQAIEKVLEASAANIAKRASVDDGQRPSTSKRQYRRRKPKPKIATVSTGVTSTTTITLTNVNKANKASTSSSPASSSASSPSTDSSAGASCSSSSSEATTNAMVSSTTTNSQPSTSKPRKGMKTAKQRLDMEGMDE